jgi:hypothetical protein
MNQVPSNRGQPRETSDSPTSGEAEGEESGSRKQLRDSSPRALGRNRTCGPRFRNSMQPRLPTCENTLKCSVSRRFRLLRTPLLPDVSRPFAGPPRGRSVDVVIQVREPARAGLGCDPMQSPIRVGGLWSEIRRRLILDSWGDARVAVAAVRSVEGDFETERPDRASGGRELLHQCGGGGLAFLGDDPRRRRARDVTH